MQAIANMQLASTVYQTIFKRNSVFVGTVFATGFAFKMYVSCCSIAFADLQCVRHDNNQYLG
jgi:hypothetical protein